MSADERLEDLLRHALAVPDRLPPPARVAKLRAEVQQSCRDAGRASIEARHRFDPRRWLVVAAAAAVALGVGLAVGSLAGEEDGEEAAGVVEFAGAAVAPDGTAAGRVEVTRIGAGRVVRIDTDELAVLPTGEYYEVWFVGPGDTPASPNRISAGTFHPDDQGRSHVNLFAAVNPAKYPTISITAEPGDGNPAPTGPEVLRVEIDPGSG